MQCIAAVGALVLAFFFLTPKVEGIAPFYKQDSQEWLPTDVYIAYQNWKEEQRAALAPHTTTSKPSSSKRAPPTTPSFHKTAGTRTIFGPLNTPDLLFRYHEARRKTSGEPSAPQFNTPCFPTTASSVDPFSLDVDLESLKTNLTESKHIPPYGKASSGIISLLTIVISCLTICGNILVLMAFYLERNLRMPTNYFIASLAVTDILIGIFSMNLYTLYLLLDYWPLGRLLCDLWLGLDYTLCLTSQYTVFFITLDRFFSVKIPARYRCWRTPNKVLIMIAVTWIIPSTVFFTTILGWPYFSKDNHVRKTDRCYAEFSSNPMFNTILTIAYFWITLSVMTALYIGIYQVALRLQRKSREKRQKVKNIVNSCGKPIDRIPPYPETNCGDSLKQPSSNLTACPPNSCDFEPENQKRNFSGLDKNEGERPQRSCGFPQYDIGNHTLPFEEPVSPIITTYSCKGERTNSYTNGCISISNTCGSPLDSPKASPTSIHEPMFSQIRSPHLSDPEITETVQIDVKALLSFPSSPAVNFFSDPESSGSSNNSSLRLSLVYSQDLVHNSASESRGGSQCNFGNGRSRGNESDFSTTDAGYRSSPNRESCRQQRHSNHCVDVVATEEKDDDDMQQVCPFLDTDPPETRVDNRRISQNTAEYVAQLWKAGLQKNAMQQNNQQTEPQIAPKKYPSNHRRTTPDTSRNSTNDTSDSLLSKKRNQHPSFSKPQKSIYGGRTGVFFSSFFQSRRALFEDTDRQTPGRTENRARKALKTISFILGAFVLCWTPYHIVILIKGFCDEPASKYTCVNEHLYSLTYWMCYLNSPVNPFCYALANAQFKQTFTRILRLDFKRR